MLTVIVCCWLLLSSYAWFVTMYINNIAKKKDLFHKPFFFFSRWGKCYVHTQLFLALYMCVFILNGFPLWLFLEVDSLLWNNVLEVFGPFYNLITRNYATNFNMNFLEVSLLL